MAKYTTNLKLELPTENEFYSIDKINANNQKIDSVAHNENLLDNGWFTVNQRAFSSDNASSGYTVDRWIIFNSSGTRSVVNAHLEVIKNGENASIAQGIEKDILESGKKYTVSINTGISLGDSQRPASFAIYDENFSPLYTYSFIESDFVDDISRHTFHITQNIHDNAKWIYFYLNEGKTKIYSCKLECSDHSTLANDHAPNYATELLKCQRYYYQFECGEYGGTDIGTCFSTTTTYIGFPMVLPIKMRTNPTVLIVGSVGIWSADIGYIACTCSYVAKTNDLVWFTLNPQGKTFTVGRSFTACVLTNSKLCFSADL